MTTVNLKNKLNNQIKPSREDAELAVKTLLQWLGDDPNREGLQETPRRVVNYYQEMFSGYSSDPKKILSKTFSDIDKYNELVLLKDIEFESCCEHHMLPVIGVAHVAYIAKNKLIGLSKLARLVDVYAKRLQTQEGMTAQILKSLDTALQPKGCYVILEAKHQCMSIRGVHKSNSYTITEKFSGCFEEYNMQQRVRDLITKK
jgi:GTP cyclohydrolase I